MPVEMKEYSYGQIEVKGDGLVKVGKFCSIAQGVKAYFLDDHRTDWITTFPFPALWEECKHIKNHHTAKRLISIENDVWIGSFVTLLGGATIRDGAVIGAFSVVAGEIPPYSIAIGNPAKPVRNRFEIDQIERLLENKWWDWPREKVLENVELLCSSELENFLRR